MDPTEFPVPSSTGSITVSVAPTQCDDHSALLIKLQPPKASPGSSDSASINMSAIRRRSSIDPPEVLQPIDEMLSPFSPIITNAVAVNETVNDETFEQMSAALALVPYDDNQEGKTTNELFSDSPHSPINISKNHALMVKEGDRQHHSSTRELVTYEPQQLVSVKTYDYPMRHGFDHCFICVPMKERLSALFATLRRNAERKMIVIFSTWESAKFHSLLFRQLELFSVYELQENEQGMDVIDSHERFLYTYPGVLFASDIALREFDIPPNVDYILQYEPPMHPMEYIYRFSSAELFETSCHKALLFLSPEGKELNFIQYFEKAGVELSELQARKVSQFQPRVEKMILKHAELNEAAWRAFRAYVIAFESHSHVDVWDKQDIDEEAVMKSFARPHFPSFVASYNKEDMIVKELISKTAKAERSSASKEKKHKEKNDSDHKIQSQGDWMRGKEKTWRSRQPKSWMTKEKSWKYGHSSMD